MKILIVEDEAVAARRLAKLVAAADAQAEIIGVCNSVNAAQQWLSDNTLPDLFLLDIQLGDGLSFDIFTDRKIFAPVIFTTAYDEYALKAFELNSIDYLLKPVEPDALKLALKKYRALYENRQTHAAIPETLIRQLLQQKPVYKSRFLVSKGSALLPVDIQQVAYFYTEDRVVFIRTHENQRYLLDTTLDDLEAQLDPALFTRANRQYIVSLDAVRQIEQGFNGKLHLHLHPVPDEQAVVSREKASGFKDWIGNR